MILELTWRRPVLRRPARLRGATALVPLALALLAALAPLGEQPPARPLAAAPAAATGRLLLPRFSGVAVLDLTSGTEEQVHRTQQPVLGASWSPDGGRVAFAQFGREPDDQSGSTELYVLEGDQAWPVVRRAGPNQLLEGAVWTPDGAALVYQASGGAVGGYSVELAALDGSERRTLERRAAAPALSPDGGLLAFVRVNGSDALVVRPLAGGEAHEVLPRDTFVGITWPRFSPDGRRLAFLGIGGPAGGRLPRPIDPFSWLRAPAVARAHGLPWDPWIVNLDGSGLRQVAELLEDDPSLAWAPDGSSLVVFGGGGLWLVSVDGSGEPSLISHGGYGTLDWQP